MRGRGGLPKASSNEVDISPDAVSVDVALCAPFYVGPKVIRQSIMNLDKELSASSRRSQNVMFQCPWVAKGTTSALHAAQDLILIPIV